MIRPKLTGEQQHNRAVNAVVQLMQKQLIVPKIFIDAAWPTHSSNVDFLAVDRAGSGEIHVAEVLQEFSDDRLEEIFEIPAHFKYIGWLIGGPYKLKTERLYAPDGFGRIGVIAFRESVMHDFHAVLELRPERFNLNPSYFKNIDKFTAKHTPTWEFRD